VAYRVYQRDVQGRAEIPLVLEPSLKGATLVSATLSPLEVGTYQFADGKFSGVPTGGPYLVNARVNVNGTEYAPSIGPIFVGDLWVLAGQSNMQGYGDLVDVTTPDPRVMALELKGNWVQAKEPLHWWLLDPKRQQIHPKGSGLGLSFAKMLVQRTNIPIGLLPCAVGGTFMTQWDPAKKNEGRRSLYGSMLIQIKRAGGRVKGLLWYQGEAEASEAASKVYPKVFSAFIAACRADLGQPDLPFYLVQLARFAVLNESACKFWNSVQETQRRIPEQIPNTAVVAGVDLELDDTIHLGTDGLKRLGHRLGLIALRELYGLPGATNPNFEKVTKGPDQTLIVKFKGVNMETLTNVLGGIRHFGESSHAGLRPARHIAGFSIRTEEGAEIVAIFDARVGLSGDAVILHLGDKLPKKAQLWYGRCHNPYCNLTDGLDMAVPAFGPIPLDDVK
jgi:hypothetical protein